MYISNLNIMKAKVKVRVKTKRKVEMKTTCKLTNEN